MSKFKWVDRGFGKTMLLIPGWASDYRIFDSLDIDYNYLLPIGLSPYKFPDGFPEALKENGLGKISVLGWSMGAFIACDLLPRFGARIDEVIMVSARRRYERANNEKIKELLGKSRKGFLLKFYRDCFCEEDRPSLDWFKRNIMKEYLDCMDLGSLVEGLDYLSEREIAPQALEGVKVTFIHGVKDVIAPAEGVGEIVKELPRARFIPIERAGHMPFMAAGFREALSGKIGTDTYFTREPESHACKGVDEWGFRFRVPLHHKRNPVKKEATAVRRWSFTGTDIKKIGVCPYFSIEKNFSRYAHLYDKYAKVQSMAARELIDRLGGKERKNILDIGCGTGNYTRLLRDKYKDASITALDISSDMVEAAGNKCGNKGIDYIVADAEKWDSPNQQKDNPSGQPLFFYDLITSNATFQWFDDLEATIKKYKELLLPGGTIAFSIFGPMTYQELGQSLKEVFGAETAISAESFLTKDAIADIMKRSFQEFCTEERFVTEEYGSLRQLLDSIKYTGTRGEGVEKMLWGRRSDLRKIEEAYAAKYVSIKATYQIFYCGSEM